MQARNYMGEDLPQPKSCVFARCARRGARRPHATVTRYVKEASRSDRRARIRVRGPKGAELRCRIGHIPLNLPRNTVATMWITLFQHSGMTLCGTIIGTHDGPLTGLCFGSRSSKSGGRDVDHMTQA